MNIEDITLGSYYYPRDLSDAGGIATAIDVPTRQVTLSDRTLTFPAELLEPLPVFITGDHVRVTRWPRMAFDGSGPASGGLHFMAGVEGTIVGLPHYTNARVRYQTPEGLSADVVLPTINLILLDRTDTGSAVPSPVTPPAETGLMRVYVAGPLNGPAADYLKNVSRMLKVTLLLHREGFAPYAPCLDFQLGLLSGELSYEDCFLPNQSWLRAAEAIFVLAHSPGTDKEIALAEFLDIPVFYADNSGLKKLKTLRDSKYPTLQKEPPCDTTQSEPDHRPLDADGHLGPEGGVV